MDDRGLADRLVGYADALAAVTFVGMSGLAIALVDPDVRCSLSESVATVALASVAFAAAVSALLVMLRRWESDVRSGLPISKKAAAYLQRLHKARLSVVWISTAGGALTVLFASRDVNCGL